MTSTISSGPVGSKTDTKENMEGKKGSMGPPAPFPEKTFIPQPPRMTRLPSLKQLSDRLHPSPVPLGINTSQPTNPSTEDDRPSTPPRLLKTANNTSSQQPTSTAYTASPSTRLKLPPSAMTRTHSSGVVPTVSGPAVSADGKRAKNEKGSPAIDLPAAVGGSPPTPMSRGPSIEGFIKGYKDVPSLAAIRARVSVSRGMAEPIEDKASNEGQQAEPMVPVGEEPDVVSPRETASSIMTEGETPARETEHSLQHAWTLFFDSKTYKPDPTAATPKEGESLLNDWEKSLLTVGKFDTVEGFARYLNNVRLPSQLARNSNYHLFKNGIRPMWEDPANAKGGKWVILFRSSPLLLDHAWANLTMSLVGEVLDADDEVCGVVASTRPKIDRIQVWTRGRDEVERINALGRKITECLALEGREFEAMSMEFQFNASHGNPPPNTYMHIPFPPPRSATFPHAPPTPSRLGANLSPHVQQGFSPTPSSPSRLHHPSLPQIPPPRSPTAPQGEMLAPPGLGAIGRRPSGGSVFAGPMGGNMGGSPSPRRENAQALPSVG